jgi:hypothetical protein
MTCTGMAGLMIIRRVLRVTRSRSVRGTFSIKVAPCGCKELDGAPEQIPIRKTETRRTRRLLPPTQANPLRLQNLLNMAQGLKIL